jgi:hypothetical protein
MCSGEILVLLKASWPDQFYRVLAAARVQPAIKGFLGYEFYRTTKVTCNIHCSTTMLWRIIHMSHSPYQPVFRYSSLRVYCSSRYWSDRRKRRRTAQTDASCAYSRLTYLNTAHTTSLKLNGSTRARGAAAKTAAVDRVHHIIWSYAWEARCPVRPRTAASFFLTSATVPRASDSNDDSSAIPATRGTTVKT